MHIIELVQQNSILIVNALLSIMILIVLWKVKQVSVNNSGGNIKSNFNLPFRQFQHTLKQKVKAPKIIILLLLAVFAASSFLSLYPVLPLWATILLFIPLTLVIVALFLQIIWWLAYIMRKLVTLENPRLTCVFSTALIMLVFISVGLWLYDLKNTDTFILMVVNLALCYLLIITGLGQLLKEANSPKRTLTFKNLWKATLLIFLLFITVLSLMSYVGLLHYDNAFCGNVALGYFDMVYYTCVTFATVGYGDIAPSVAFTKAVSILTITTSIITITILLSAMMSVRKSEKE